MSKDSKINFIGLLDGYIIKSFIFLLAFMPLATYAQKKLVKESYNTIQSKKYIQYGFKEIEKGNYQRAIEFANQAVEFDSDQYLAFYLRAEARMYTDNYDRQDVIQDLNFCIKHNPHFAHAYFERSHLEENTDKVKAYDDLTTAISYADKINLGDYYSSRGMLLIDMLDWTGALKDVNMAIKLNPTCENALRSRGQIYIEYEKYVLAINDLDKAIHIEPTSDAFTFYYRAIAKAKLGKIESSCADFAKAKELVGTAQFNETIEKYCK